MPLLTIQKRCNDCEATRSALRALSADVEQYRSELERFRLDFENLYDKVRTNLSKLARRTEAPESPVTDDLQARRGMTAGQILRQRHRGA